MIAINLPGEPLSTQHIYSYGKGRKFLTGRARDRKDEYAWEVRAQYHDGPLLCPLSIAVVLYFGDKKKRDIDNFFKLALDSLNGRVWNDDEQITELHVIKEYDKKNPRIEIRVV